MSVLGVLLYPICKEVAQLSYILGFLPAPFCFSFNIIIVLFLNALDTYSVHIFLLQLSFLYKKTNQRGP